MQTADEITFSSVRASMRSYTGKRYRKRYRTVNGEKAGSQKAFTRMQMRKAKKEQGLSQGFTAQTSTPIWPFIL